MATLEGINCVVIETDLEETDPMLYQFLVSFGEENNLELIHTDVFPPVKTATA